MPRGSFNFFYFKHLSSNAIVVIAITIFLFTCLKYCSSNQKLQMMRRWWRRGGWFKNEEWIIWRGLSDRCRAEYSLELIEKREAVEENPKETKSSISSVCSGGNQAASKGEQWEDYAKKVYMPSKRIRKLNSHILVTENGMISKE